jgi:hypothetical protein
VLTHGTSPLDADTDGDGIPDVVEAQPTSTYTAPLGDLDLDGFDDAWGPAGIAAQDTDGTGGPDLLDADADDDGTSDALEGGTLPSGVDADGDGLDAAVDPDDSAWGPVDAGFVDPATELIDSDLDLTLGGEVDYRDAVHDGDDRDLDGLTDNEEILAGSDPDDP